MVSVQVYCNYPQPHHKRVCLRSKSSNWTFLYLKLVSQFLPAVFQPLDVPEVLTNLRSQRMMMVQTLSQYSFIYKVLIEYLRNSRLIWTQESEWLSTGVEVYPKQLCDDAAEYASWKAAVGMRRIQFWPHIKSGQTEGMCKHTHKTRCCMKEH